MLCMGYCILLKIHALRLKSVISNIIHQDQTGFITERYISSNIIALCNRLYNQKIISYLIYLC